VAVAGGADLGAAGIEAQSRPGVDRAARVLRFDLGQRQRHRRVAELGVDQLQRLAIWRTAEQQAGLVVLQQQDDGKQFGLERRQRLAHHPAREAGTTGGALEQRRSQAALLERQASQRGVTGGSLAMAASQNQQTG